MNKYSSKEIKKRTIKSFAIMFVMFFIAIVSWSIVSKSNSSGDISNVLRFVLEGNGKLWHVLLSDKKIDVIKKIPAKGQEPRVNGDIGLEDVEDIDDWSLSVEVGSRKLNLNIDEIKSLPKTDATAEFRCIEGWSENLAYSGVKFSDFVSHYNLDMNYKYVGLETPDEKYYVSIDMKSMLHPQTLLAYEMNFMPLSQDNGFPLRLIIPVKYGIKHLKRIGKIYFSNIRPRDYWEKQGYDWFSGL